MRFICFQNWNFCYNFSGSFFFYKLLLLLFREARNSSNWLATVVQTLEAKEANAIIIIILIFTAYSPPDRGLGNDLVAVTDTASPVSRSISSLFVQKRATMLSAKLAIAVKAIVRFYVTRQATAIDPGMMLSSLRKYVITLSRAS